LALLGVLLIQDFKPFNASLVADDPRNFVGGKLNQEAVATVTSFPEYPVLWLEEEYQGFKLTAVQRSEAPSPGGWHDSLLIVYGSCASRDACVPPIAIITTAPGHVPVPTGRPLPEADDLDTTRGLFSGFVACGVYTTGGLVFEAQANAVACGEVLDALTLANPGSFGLPAIGPGDSLAPLHTWEP
jgi:hypothetical protein